MNQWQLLYLKFAEFCNFGRTLEEMLRDRIVCGISDDTIQRHLLAEPGLTYKKALQGIEAANRNMRELHRPSANSSKQRDIASVNNEINKVAPNPTGKSETCYRKLSFGRFLKFQQAMQKKQPNDNLKRFTCMHICFCISPCMTLPI